MSVQISNETTGKSTSVSDKQARAIGSRTESWKKTSNAPAKSANKDEWVDFAVSSGVDRAEAEAKTKEQLINDHS